MQYRWLRLDTKRPLQLELAPMKNIPRRFNHQAILIIGCFFVVVLYIFGVRQQFLYVNTDLQATDQGAYMEEAKAMVLSDYTYMTGRNRMPVYPFLQSLLYTPSLSDEAFFARGKMANVVLSLFMLPLLFLIFRRFLPLFTAVNLILITTFTLFIFKAAYFQVELLFYFLYFVMYLLLCKMLVQPTWKLGLVTGIVIGLTHLTKASVLPALILFVAMAGLKLFSLGIRSFSQQKSTASIRIQVFSYALVLLAFMMTIWPYIHNSKARFGHYFYNVNSTFYIWYDSWEEVENGTKAHGDREHWPDMPDHEIPSADKYLREHSSAEIWQRFTDGFLALLGNTLYSYGYFGYFLFYTLFLSVLALLNIQRTHQIIWEHFLLVLFNLGFFVGYFLLYVWYAPIMPGNRLILAQFLPYMFAVSYTIYCLFSEHLHVQVKQSTGQHIDLGLLFNVLIFVSLLVNMAALFTDRINTIYGGY